MSALLINSIALQQLRHAVWGHGKILASESAMLQPTVHTEHKRRWNHLANYLSTIVQGLKTITFCMSTLYSWPLNYFRFADISCATAHLCQTFRVRGWVFYGFSSARCKQIAKPELIWDARGYIRLFLTASFDAPHMGWTKWGVS